VKSGVEAFRTAANPVGSVSVAMAMSVNGIAENAAPTTANVLRSRRAMAHVRRPAISRRMNAPIAIRISAAHTGPTSGPAIRRNRKAAPQTAPRKRS
jgi:hypothetical protein